MGIKSTVLRHHMSHYKSKENLKAVSRSSAETEAQDTKPDLSNYFLSEKMFITSIYQSVIFARNYLTNRMITLHIASAERLAIKH